MYDDVVGLSRIEASQGEVCVVGISIRVAKRQPRVVREGLELILSSHGKMHVAT